MSNPVVKWQIVCREPEQVASFYSRLFNWEVDTNNSLGYRMFRNGNGRGIEGGVWPRGEEGHNLVQVFVEVDDVDSYLEKAVSLGGKVVFPRQELPDGDALAIVVDPAGLSVGLYRAASTGSR